MRDSARDSGELMENSGNSARDSARDSGELRGELRDSGDSDHPFWRTQGELRWHLPSDCIGAVLQAFSNIFGQILLLV